MSKEIFCKIIELDETQVLVVKSIDEDSPEEFPSIEVTMKVEGLSVTQKMTFESEENRDIAFDKVDIEAAKTIYEGVFNFLTKQS